MMTTRRVLIVLLAGSAALAVAILPRPERNLPRRPADRVVLLGFDGAAPNLLEPLVAAGHLPALERLMKSGAYGPLRTFKPVKSAVLWTTVATGKTMLKHGIVDWTYVDAAGIQTPYEGTARRARTYWEILDEQGLATATLGWWLTYPPPRLSHGMVVSDAFRALPEARTVHPPELHAALEPLRPRPRDVRREWARFGLPGYEPEKATLPLHGMAGSVIGAYRGYLLADLTIDRASDAVWRRGPVDVFSTYFRFVDVTGHFGLHFADPATYAETLALQAAGPLPPEALARMDGAMARAVLPAYRLMDSIVAKYLRQLDQRTLLIICSDHGFGWHAGAYTHYHRAQEAPHGVLFLLGPGVRRGYRVQGASLLDIAPTVLHAMGQAVGADMDGFVLERAFEDRWRQRFPVRKRATYETGRALQEAGPRDRRLDQKVLEDLRTLGYIDARDEARP